MGDHAVPCSKKRRVAVDKEKKEQEEGEGHEKFTDSSQFTQNIPLEVSPNLCRTSTEPCLEFMPPTIKLFLAWILG